MPDPSPPHPYLDPDGEALASPQRILLAVLAELRDGGRRGGDGDGAAADVLAGGAMHLRVGRLNGRRQRLHAVYALRGVAEA